MIDNKQVILIVIDVQGKLATLMQEKDQLFFHLRAMTQAAKIFNIPIIYTEQAPEKIGKTVSPVRDLLTDQQPIEKKSFSCCGSKDFLLQLESLKRNSIIIMGIETHVCVYQTVSDLLKQRFHVEVVVDAVSSRSQLNTDIALERMKDLGAQLTTTEMIICELLKTAEHEKFREIMKLIK